LQGGEQNIAALLRVPQRFLIMTYQQLARDRVPRHVAEFISLRTVFVFVDESHRIKGRGITSRTVRDLAFLPNGKLIMSGTPMPQAVDDLLTQFEFLYPEVEADTSNVVDKMRAVFVRTTKRELGLPEPQRLCVPVPMLPAQRRLYDLLKKEVLRQAEATLTAKDRNAFRALGRSVMRVLQLVSNPALLAASAAIREDLLAAAIDEGDSPKLDYACRRARQLTAQSKKVLIWSAFRENVETISERLFDLGAVFIHGGVDAGDEEKSDTREGRIRRFHDDGGCKVLVANPAAARSCTTPCRSSPIEPCPCRLRGGRRSRPSPG
jgi:SNF2 family DNA or RNA helicase